MKKQSKIKNTIALKKGLFSIIITTAVIVAVVFANFGVTALCDRFPLDLDITSDKIHSMSSENIDYIKGIDKEVNIYVCLTEEEYIGAQMQYYAATYYYVDTADVGAVKYYNQTVDFLKNYSKYNSNITITFLDLSVVGSQEILENFADYSFTYGDILIESKSVGQDGKEAVRRTAVTFDQIYSTTEMSDMTAEMYTYASYGYGVGYMISKNNIETALSSAIYKVISDDTPVYLVPSDYCDTAYITDYLKATLESNNYSLVFKSGFLSDLLPVSSEADNSVYSEYTGIILAGMTGDVSEEDSLALDSFLNNGEARGKSLVFFASTNSYKHTVLNGFLSKWGVALSGGVVYDTSYNYVSSDGNTTVYMSSKDNEITQSSDARGKLYLAKNSVPLTAVYEKNATSEFARETSILLQTRGYGTSTIMPADAGSDWKPASDAKYDAYPSVIMTTDERLIGDVDDKQSYVVTFSAEDFIASKWVTNQQVANLYFVLDIFNGVSGQTETPLNFVGKNISNDTFIVGSGFVTAAKVAFVFVIPILVIISGIAIFVWRKNR